MVAHGFTFEMLQDLARTRLVTANRDAVGTEKTKLMHLRITPAARKALAD
jgi:hypothetical protein